MLSFCLVSLSPLSGQAGREDRKQYGFKKRKKSLFSSSTNREKVRNKILSDGQAEERCTRQEETSQELQRKREREREREQHSVHAS